MEHVEPFARRMISDRMRPDRLLADLAHTAGDLAGIVRDIPIELRDIFDLVRAGKIHIEFEHRGLEPMLVKHDQLVTRIVYALVLSSLLIGSSLIVHSGVPPVVFGIPLIGLAGFLATGVMGFGLLISILRNRRM